MSPGHFYIDGHWLEPAQPAWQDLVDPVTESASMVGYGDD